MPLPGSDNQPTERIPATVDDTTRAREDAQVIEPQASTAEDDGGSLAPPPASAPASPAPTTKTGALYLKPEDDPRIKMAREISERNRQEHGGKIYDPQDDIPLDYQVDQTPQGGVGQPPPASTGPGAVPHTPPAHSPPQDRIITLSVNGEQVQISEQRLAQNLSKIAEADRRLQEAEFIRRQALEAAARPQSQGTTRPSVAPTARTDTPTPQGTDTVRDEELAEIFDTIQAGATDEGVKALRTLINKAAQQQQPVDVTRVVRSELVRSNDEHQSRAALQSLIERHQSTFADPELQEEAAATVKAAGDRVIADDLRRLNFLTEDQIALAKAQGKLGDLHAILRSDPNARSRILTQDQIVAKIEATPAFKRFFGQPAQQQPQSRAGLQVQVDRSGRKVGLTSQPAQRTHPQAPAQRQMSLPETRQSAIAKMAAARGQLLGGR